MDRERSLVVQIAKSETSAGFYLYHMNRQKNGLGLVLFGISKQWDWVDTRSGLVMGQPSPTRYGGRMDNCICTFWGKT